MKIGCPNDIDSCIELENELVDSGLTDYLKTTVTSSSINSRFYNIVKEVILHPLKARIMLTYTESYVYDAKLEKILTLNDIIKVEWKELALILLRAYNEQAGPTCKSNSIDDFTISPDGFYLESDGIKFYFNNGFPQNVGRVCEVNSLFVSWDAISIYINEEIYSAIMGLED